MVARNDVAAVTPITALSLRDLAEAISIVRSVQETASRCSQ